MGQGSKRLLIIVTVDYTASAYSETGALPVSPLYGMQGIAELDPSKHTSDKVETADNIDNCESIASLMYITDDMNMTSGAVRRNNQTEQGTTTPTSKFKRSASLTPFSPLSNALASSALLVFSSQR